MGLRTGAPSQREDMANLCVSIQCIRDQQLYRHCTHVVPQSQVVDLSEDVVVVDVRVVFPVLLLGAVVHIVAVGHRLLLLG